ncbi:glycosyltransferase [Mesorhizobium muleiense]|uniref:glycosyltransferase n=1 Tax=Mesorhizobium muleiense TaxID=1004279 RepID=UPI003AFB4EED
MQLNRHDFTVAVVTGSVSRLAGGLFQSVRRSSQTIHQLGVGVEVISIADPYTVRDVEAWLPIVPSVSAALGSHRTRYAPGVLTTLLDRKFDIVHQHGLWMTTSIQVSSWRGHTRGKVVISPRGMLDRWALGNSYLKKRIAAVLYEDRNLRSANCLHALNVSEAKAIRSYGLSNPIAVIPNGVDLPDDVEPGQVRRPSWLPNDDRCNLLFLGRIHPKKGISELIEAWAILRHTKPSVAKRWRLLIAGWDDGGHEHRLRAEVANRGLCDDILFPGQLYGADKDAALRHVDAFILPSHSEGLPMSVLEAWSHRLPVFMTDACNLPEGFLAGAAIKIGVESEELASELATGLTDGNLTEMGNSGRALVEASYGWTQIAQKQISLYKMVLEGKSLPDITL